jgi:hypothetical protein
MLLNPIIQEKDRPKKANHVEFNFILLIFKTVFISINGNNIEKYTTSKKWPIPL